MKRVLSAIVVLTLAGCALWVLARRSALEDAESRLTETRAEHDRLKAELGDLLRLPRDRMIAEREQRLLRERLAEHPAAAEVMGKLSVPEDITLLELEVRSAR